jgi:hypothetical protein
MGLNAESNARKVTIGRAKDFETLNERYKEGCGFQKWKQILKTQRDTALGEAKRQRGW